MRIFLPFAAGYFLSYLFRTVNAVIGPVLARELALPDNALGLLTSTYFLAFGVAQLPIGLLLDRYGPRRVESALLLLAAAGTVVFALSETPGGLALGRTLIGLGVSACLMAAFKAFALWFAPERQASLTGWVMASGALGALAASRPLEIAIGLAGWRAVVLFLGLLTAAVALFIRQRVPDSHGDGRTAGLGRQLAGLKLVFRSGHFWRHAPPAFFLTGGFMAVQGLWASRWMMVVERLDGTRVADRLTGMSLGLLGGFLLTGFFATALVRRGVSLARIYTWAMLGGFAALALLVALPGSGGTWLWPLLGLCFSLSNIAYSLVAKAFPPEMSGRATTALNLLVFSGAFGLQWGIGVLTDALQAAGWAADAAYRGTFAALLGAQALALLGFFLPRRPV